MALTENYDFAAPLSPEGEALIAIALAEFKPKQDALEAKWQFSSFSSWTYDPDASILGLTYPDGQYLEADGDLLGTYCISTGTFEWAWNSPHFEHAPIEGSRRMLAVGRQLGISYLMGGMIPVPSPEMVSYLCALGMQITSSESVFVGTDGDVVPLIAIKNVRTAQAPVLAAHSAGWSAGKLGAGIAALGLLGYGAYAGYAALVVRG